MQNHLIVSVRQKNTRKVKIYQDRTGKAADGEDGQGLQILQIQKAPLILLAHPKRLTRIFVCHLFVIQSSISQPSVGQSISQSSISQSVIQIEFRTIFKIFKGMITFFAKTNKSINKIKPYLMCWIRGCPNMKFLFTKCLENSDSCVRKKTNLNKHLQCRIIRNITRKNLRP